MSDYGLWVYDPAHEPILDTTTYTARFVGSITVNVPVNDRIYVPLEGAQRIFAIVQNVGEAKLFIQVQDAAGNADENGSFLYYSSVNGVQPDVSYLDYGVA